MDSRRVLLFFKRFSKAKLHSLCQEYGLESNLTKGTSNKEDLAGILAQATISGKLTMKDLERIDLQNCMHRQNMKWNAYQIIGKVKKPNLKLCDADYVQNEFEEQLNYFINSKVTVLTHNSLFWIKVSLNLRHTNRILSPNTIYMVYIPGSVYILISSMKKIHRRYISKAIEETFSCHDIKDLQLSGKNVDSLCEIILNKSCQGYLNDNMLHRNPLSKKRKREIPDDYFDNVINEQLSRDKKVKATIRNTYGHNRQPSLEKVVYTVKSRFRGEEHAPLFSDNVIECTVKFSGTNVLEGLKRLVHYGVASSPLPGHLARIRSLARNRFILTEK